MIDIGLIFQGTNAFFLKAGYFFSSARSRLALLKYRGSIINKLVRRSRKKKKKTISVACYTCCFVKLVFYFWSTRTVLCCNGTLEEESNEYSFLLRIF